MNGQEVRSDDIASFLYHSGFLQANFADTHLVLHNSPQPFPPYSLHALIVARSPKLFEQLKRAAGPPYAIHLEASDPNLTIEGLNLALGSLYNGRKEVPSQLNIGVLAACQMLKLDELGRIAWEGCLNHFRTPAGLAEGFRFALSPTSESIPGSTAPSASPSSYDGPYPQYTTGLLPSLMKFLITTIPSEDSEGILAHLPFPLFKSVLESEELQMTSMERHNFARQMVAKRKKFLEPGVEESVVMAFGTDSRSGGIEVLRKDKASRKKTLWKAGQNGR